MVLTPAHADHLSRFLADLTQAGVDFVVCGGVACVLHGVARVTNDVDIYADLTDENMRRFVAVAEQWSMTLRAPEPLTALADASRREDWVQNKNAVVATLTAPDTTLQIDVFLTYPIPFDDLRARADVFSIADESIAVSSKRDLIAAKQSVVPPRKIDLRDIEDLRALLGDED